MEGDGGDTAVFPPGECCDLSRRRIHPHHRIIARFIDQTGIQPHFYQADDAMPTHRAEPLVVQEKHAQVTIRRDRPGDDTAIHIRMAARFPH